MGTVPVESQIKSRLSKKKMRVHVMFWRLSQEKVNTQMFGYLTRAANTTCAQKGSGSVLTSLMVEAAWSETTPCKTVSIDNIRMRMFDGQVRTLTNVRHIPDLKKNFLSLGSLEARGYKFFGADGGIKITKGSMRFSKENGQQTCTSWHEALLLVMLQQQQRRRIL